MYVHGASVLEKGDDIHTRANEQMECYHYDMNVWLEGRRKSIESFFNNYGKVSIVSFSLFLGVVSVCLLVISITPQKLRISFLDVGQGDSIFIQTPSGHSMLVDGGASDVVLTRLGEEMNYFDKNIDVMVATHGDADHVTGLIPVLEKYSVEKIVVSPVRAETSIFSDLEKRIQEENGNVYVGARGDEIDFGDGVLVHILYPRKSISQKIDTNDASVSFVLTYGEHSFVLTGDLTSTYEPQLLGISLPKNVTVYKAGHHGSKTSSGEQLLSYIRPEYSVISAGKENKYGHPNPEVLARLQTYSKEVLSTVEHGTISFESDGRIVDMKVDK